MPGVVSDVVNSKSHPQLHHQQNKRWTITTISLQSLHFSKKIVKTDTSKIK